MDNRNDMTLLSHSFIYEVNRATASLMYLLQGMESVRNRELPSYDELPPARRGSFPNFAKPPGVDVPLVLSGKSFDPHDVLDPEGEAEQLAFKGWVEQVYKHIWEAQYRNRLKDALGDGDAIRPLAEPLGNFRLIRNDLIHNKGVASAGETGKCTLLRWFKPGDRIVLGMHHVFDFLNQMAFMNLVGGFVSGGPYATWSTIEVSENVLRERAVPRLVSSRVALDRRLDDGSVYYVVTVVFENGVFSRVPVREEPSERTWPEWIEFVNKTRIDEEGNLRLAGGRVLHRQALYHESVEALLNPGPNPDGIQDYGPWFQFRK